MCARVPPTLTATSSCWWVLAWYTWPRDAAATGCSDHQANTSEGGAPSSSCRMAAAVVLGKGGEESCRPASAAASRGPTTSGRTASVWPSLTHSGPRPESRRCTWAENWAVLVLVVAGGGLLRWVLHVSSHSFRRACSTCVKAANVGNRASVRWLLLGTLGEWGWGAACHTCKPRASSTVGGVAGVSPCCVGGWNPAAVAALAAGGLEVGASWWGALRAATRPAVGWWALLHPTLQRWCTPLAAPAASMRGQVVLSEVQHGLPFQLGQQLSGSGSGSVQGSDGLVHCTSSHNTY